MRILFIGDIVGKGGRRTVTRLLPAIRKEENVDVVVANAENIAHGTGVTRKTLEEVRAAGVDVFTSGNHIMAKPEAAELLADSSVQLLRPHNYTNLPGSGIIHLTVGIFQFTVINLAGRVFLPETDVKNPFTVIDELLEEKKMQNSNAALVDFHAEATSEKVAFGWFVDGRVSAVVGTHTHIATADERVLTNGTAFVTDAGMTGPHDSVLGVDTDVIISTFTEETNKRHVIPEEGIMRFNSVIIDIDPKTRLATSIRRFDRTTEV